MRRKGNSPGDPAFRPPADLQGSHPKSVKPDHINNRPQAKSAAREEGEERFRAMVESAPDAMVLTDAEGKITFVNQQTEKLFGYDRQELIGQQMEILLPERFRKQHALHRAGYMKNPHARPMGADLDPRGKRKNGSEFPVEVSLSPTATKGSRSPLVSRIIRDVSQQRAAAEQLRQAALSEERNRLARDVHDTLAQGLTGIVLQLEAAEEEFKKGSPGSLRHIARARELARATLNEARASVLSLSASNTEKKNLSDSIRDLVDRFRSETPVRITFPVAGTPRPVADPIEENLVRVAQQAVTNALQHSQATRIQVELKFSKNRLQLSVTDNGIGFVASKVSDGFGLQGMRERIKGLGGKFALTSKPGKGAQIHVQVPINET